MFEDVAGIVVAAALVGPQKGGDCLGFLLDSGQAILNLEGVALAAQEGVGYEMIVAHQPGRQHRRQQQGDTGDLAIHWVTGSQVAEQRMKAESS
jgi:hypothetical protein